MWPWMEILQAAMLFATPLLVAALGELVVERAGVVNIGIEGMMLAGALAAWAVCAIAGPAWGTLAGMAAAVALALLFALAILRFAADHIVTGTGINLIAFGVTALVFKKIDPLLAERKVVGISPWWMTAVAVTLALAGTLLFWFTRRGLEWTAIGEAPHAADSAGIPVMRRQLSAIVIGGMCAGLAGAYLSTMRVVGFVENMTEGQGFLALALVIFGRWTPLGVLAAGVFFGLVRALGNVLEIKSHLPGAGVQLFKLLPYVVSLLALAGVGGRSGAPAHLGRPYLRAGGD